MTKDILDKINKFTRREFAEEELYTFSVILCDNDIDRDCERFSDGALDTLKDLFIGKTGIFDHDPSTANQTARIFDTELITDDCRRTKNGEPYKYLKASAYMVRTDENRDLIAQIDGGIKKEVSISCSAAKKICSVCGSDKSKTGCAHVKGKSYGGKLCHNVLDDISDAYEWSFVAVPAQVNAGVTKRSTYNGVEKSAPEDTSDREAELRSELRRLAFIKGGRQAADALSLSAKNMSLAQLEVLRKTYQRFAERGGADVQLSADLKDDSAAAYKI